MCASVSLRCALLALAYSTVQTNPKNVPIGKTSDHTATAAEIRRAPESPDAEIPATVKLMNMMTEKGKSQGAETQAVNLMSEQQLKSGALSQMRSCVQDFAPFPETGYDARNRFIVDLAYEMGCVMDDSGKEVDGQDGNAGGPKSCRSEILSMQKLSNAGLNEKCGQTASFPDMCGGCLASKNLREKGECGLMSQTERKNTIVSELQRLEANSSTMPLAKGYQHMSPHALIQSCAAKTFTDWCAVLATCGAPEVPKCATMSQQDKKNTFIYLALESEKGFVKVSEADLQAETDAALKSGCQRMSLLEPSMIEIVEKKVASAREERLAALQERRSQLEKYAESL